MKKITKITSLLLVAVLMMTMSGCADNKSVQTLEHNKKVKRTYVPYGLFDGNKENPNVEYEVSIGNVVWGILLFETIVAPIIIFGWYLYEPVGPKVIDPNLRGVKV